MCFYSTESSLHLSLISSPSPPPSAQLGALLRECRCVYPIQHHIAGFLPPLPPPPVTHHFNNHPPHSQAANRSRGKLLLFSFSSILALLPVTGQHEWAIFQPPAATPAQQPIANHQLTSSPSFSSHHNAPISSTIM